MTVTHWRYVTTLATAQPFEVVDARHLPFGVERSAPILALAHLSCLRCGDRAARCCGWLPHAHAPAAALAFLEHLRQHRAVPPHGSRIGIVYALCATCLLTFDATTAYVEATWPALVAAITPRELARFTSETP